MKILAVEEVFTTNGVPKHTFIKPKEYSELMVALRTPGKGVVLEGPSGIGKTSSFKNAIQELPYNGAILELSARKTQDVEIISTLEDLKPFGFVIIDDFHKLNVPIQQKIADLMKVIADESDRENKIVIVGINQAGKNLISLAHDLNNRIEVIRFESNSEERIEELISKGEEALNIEINIKPEIKKASNGSFYVAQMLCYHTCLFDEKLQTQDPKASIEVSFELINKKVTDVLSRKFKDSVVNFCEGSRLRKEGRAPYLHMLNWIAESGEWSINLDRYARDKENMGNSIAQAKSYIEGMITKDSVLREVIFFQERNGELIIQDPQFMYYLRQLPWTQFAKEVGYISITFPSKYDIALSFSGSDRSVAESLFDKLTEMDFSVFYDKNEQHRILAQDVEDYLSPIYQSEAQLIVAIISKDYPKRIWTRFESDLFRNRIYSSDVVPILFSDVEFSHFDSLEKIGRLSYDSGKNLSSQTTEISKMLRKKIEDLRYLD
ncbi:TIR domain-containing protein [Leptospira kmetyi]|uniref:TIR domain-containing protein n=1 Tax=Leptospira kmetyi TaxID=408139 RepID=A0ABX4N898_9LEPT|nr:AAA family ATPase [Leptospira kmetyi]PJZ29617.1 hypothetical protein CH378_11740 [Leptospira kmetyi]